MKRIKWSLYRGSRHIDSGTALAEDDREVLRQILARELSGGHDLKLDECYTIRAGELLASSYGDEFVRTGQMVGSVEERTDVPGGYLFPSPTKPRIKVSWDDPKADPLRDIREGIKAMDRIGDLVCPKGGAHDMNGDAVRGPLVYPKCLKCGKVANKPARDATDEEQREWKRWAKRMTSMGMAMGYGGRALREAIERLGVLERQALLDHIDPDQAREERAMEESVGQMVASGIIDHDEARNLIGGIRAGATLPEIDPTKRLGVLGCTGPDDHSLMRREDPVTYSTVFACSRCGRSYAVPDTVAATFNGDIERMVREALS